MARTRTLLARMALGAIVWAAGCSRGVVPAAPEPLDGLALSVRPTGAPRLVVEGVWEGEPVDVVLEVAQPLSSVAVGCYEAPPDNGVEVRVPLPSGETLTAKEVVLRDLRLGGRALGELPAWLQDAETCRITLGNDVLAPYALTFDPQRRSVEVTRSRPRSAWTEALGTIGPSQAGLEQHLVELVRDPVTDWPLLAVRVKQGEAAMTGAFVLTTGEAESVLDRDAAMGAGFQLGPDFLRDLEFPPNLELPQSLRGDAFPLERLELAPGFGLGFANLRGEPGWTNPGAIGVIAGDVWGRFITTIDPAAGVLVLRRPRVLVSGSRQRCAVRDRRPSEESCFVLFHEEADRGLNVAATVWRDLPEGARLYLEFLDGQGRPLDGACRVGLSFGRSDRGVNSAYQLPWGPLARGMPECAEMLASAKSVRFSLWQSEPHPECAGTCAFVHDLVRQRLSCHCEKSSSSTLGEAEQRFLELYKQILQKKQPKRAPAADEPKDPE